MAINRKCDVCMYMMNGECPFGFACKLSTYQHFKKKRLENEHNNNNNIFVPVSQTGGGIEC